MSPIAAHQTTALWFVRFNLYRIERTQTNLYRRKYWSCYIATPNSAKLFRDRFQVWDVMSFDVMWCHVMSCDVMWFETERLRCHVILSPPETLSPSLCNVRLSLPETLYFSHACEMMSSKWKTSHFGRLLDLSLLSALTFAIMYLQICICARSLLKGI